MSLEGMRTDDAQQSGGAAAAGQEEPARNSEQPSAATEQEAERQPQGSSGEAAEQVRLNGPALHAADRHLPDTATRLDHPSASHSRGGIQKSMPQKAAEASHAKAWASYQEGASLSIQRSHSDLPMPASAIIGSLPQPQQSLRRSFDSVAPSPFSAFASESIDAGDTGTVGQHSRLSIRTAPMPLPFCSHSDSTMWQALHSTAAAAAAVPIPGRPGLQAERQASLQKLPSLQEWAGAPLRRPSTERLPSLQDWVMPSLGSSPKMLRRRSLHSPIPEHEAAAEPPLGSSLFCSESLPKHTTIAGKTPGHDCGGISSSVACRDALLDEPLGSSPEASEPTRGWRTRAPRSPPRQGRLILGTPPRCAAGFSYQPGTSPKRDRSSYDEGIFVGSFEEPIQPAKSPRLHRRHASDGQEPSHISSSSSRDSASAAAGRQKGAGGPSVVRTGSPRSSREGGPGFADFHAVIDSIWGDGNHVNRAANGPESAPVG